MRKFFLKYLNFNCLYSHLFPDTEHCKILWMRMILKAAQLRMMVQPFANERIEQVEVHAQKLEVHAHNFFHSLAAAPHFE